MISIALRVSADKASQVLTGEYGVPDQTASDLLALARSSAPEKASDTLGEFKARYFADDTYTLWASLS